VPKRSQAPHKGKEPLPGLSGEGLRIAIVASRFNGFVVEKLLAGAHDRLIELGVAPPAITLVRIPGAFELPQAVKQLSATGTYDGIIPLGCIIRGETPHFDYLSQAVSQGLMRLSLESQTPIVFGVLTVNTIKQALARVGKGAEAAESLIELIQTLRSVANMASS
jgi:6,7-dimethyl-8-ribityllumazine synthase